MSASYNYSRGILRQVVYILATGKGDVRSRLLMTYRHIRMLNTDNMPSELHGDLKWIKRMMVKYGASVDDYGAVESALKHTMRRIRNSTGKTIAEEICSIYSRLLSR